MSIIVWTLAFLVAIGFFLYQVYGRFGVLFRLRRDDRRNYGSTSWFLRTKNTLYYAFGQAKFFRDGGVAGFLHMIVFWGFLILGVQVATMFIRGWFPGFHVPGFSMSYLGGPYALLKDIFQALVACGICVLLYRWLISKPQRLFGFLPAEARLNSHNHVEAIVILCFIMMIMKSGYLYDAGRIVALAGDPDIAAEAQWQPISAWIATWFGGNVELATNVSNTAWWVHNGVILAFLNLLPRSKHFHIITAVPNVFFGRIEPKGRIVKNDFTVDEPLFGRSQPKHFTWKQGLDMYSCTECGRCSSMCPATATKKPLAPRQFLLDLRDNLYANQSKLLKTGTTEEYPVVVGGEFGIPDEVIWSCNACRACEEACPVNIEYVDKIVAIRQYLVQEASRFPDELNRTFKGLENNSNPWGISSEERFAWAEGLHLPTIDSNPNPEYLYYVGCGGSFDANGKNTTKSFVEILKQAGVNFAVLGKKELCNGETARRLGNEYLYQSMAEALIAVLNATGVKKILVNCPHCFNTLANEYPEFGGTWHVQRAAELVDGLIAQGKVKLTESLDKKVVYHDSCYYGRFNDVFDEQRNVLSSIPGAKVEEMRLNKKQGTCCGAGGGRMWVEEPADQRVNVMRAEQALEKSPDVVAVSCPFCRIMIGNGITDKGAEDKVQVMDVMQLVASSMEKSPPAV